MMEGHRHDLKRFLDFSSSLLTKDAAGDYRFNLDTRISAINTTVDLVKSLVGATYTHLREHGFQAAKVGRILRPKRVCSLLYTEHGSPNTRIGAVRRGLAYAPTGNLRFEPS